jgi:lipoate-protein ligase B
MNERSFTYCDLGFIDYKEAWDLQKEVLNLRSSKKVQDILFLLEHPHTYTLGKTADKKNLVSTPNFLSSNKISVYEIDRGGDITYHGPGQIVGYPIIDLNEWEKDTHKFLRALEEVLINTCADYGIKAERNSKYTGVWINNRKIAAIGIKISRWVTMHGFAFNVNTDLNLFKGIIPCGIPDKDVTSLQKELSRRIDISSVKKVITENFRKIFGYSKYIQSDKENLFESAVPAL